MFWVLVSYHYWTLTGRAGEWILVLGDIPKFSGNLLPVGNIIVFGIIPSKSVSVEIPSFTLMVFSLLIFFCLFSVCNESFTKTIFRAKANCLVSYDLVKMSCFNRWNCPLTRLLGCSFQFVFQKRLQISTKEVKRRSERTS